MEDRFKYFQKKIIEHLSELEAEENREESRISKSLATQEFFDRLMKSRGYEVGTVREWKGKKYKKIAQNKWVRVYDKDSSSARRSIGQIKHMAEKCTTSQELLQLVLKYRDRFSAENGHPLPIVQELSDYVSKRNDEIESGVKKETEKPAEKNTAKVGENLKLGEIVYFKPPYEPEIKLKVVGENEEGVIVLENVKTKETERISEGLLYRESGNEEGSWVLPKNYATEKESEAEKRKNRSDAMKGNKNAYKGYMSDDKVQHVKKMDYEVFEEKNTDKDVFAAHHKDGKFVGISMNKDVAEMIDKMDVGFDGEDKVASEIHEKYPKVKESYVKQMLRYISMGVGKSRKPAKVLVHENRVSNDIPKEESKEDKKTVTPEDKKLSNGKTVKEMREKYGIKTKTEKKAEKEEKTENDSAFKGSNLETVAAKYATDKEIAKLVKRTDSVDFTSQDVNRFFMCGTYQDNGYVIATDGRMLSMIKADYPAEEKWKVKGNAKIMKQLAKDVENYKTHVEEAKTKLSKVEDTQGKGSVKYKLALEDVEEAKKDLASAEEQLKTGFIHGQFPNYKRVIPDESRSEKAEGFEDFDKVMKTAMIAAAYAKHAKKDFVPVRVGNKNFNARMLVQCMAMAKKHGLTNVITPDNNTYSAVSFSGENGAVVLMPMKTDDYTTVFYSDRGMAKFGEGENSEEFLSAGEKEHGRTTSKKVEAAQKQLYSGFVSDVYNKILKMTGSDNGEGGRKLKYNNGNLNFREADYMFNKTWDEKTQKRHRADFVEKYGTEKGNKIIDAILEVQKLTNWVSDYKHKVANVSAEDNKYHSRDVENYIKEQTSKIRAKLGMQKSMPIIMVRKSVYEDCMKLLRG